MSLFLLLDEDSQAKHLLNLLRMAGHDVMTANEANISGYPDEKVLEYARDHRRVLLTRNCADFQELHQTNPNHPGILAVYQDADPSKNMSYQAIAKAINNLETSGLVLTNQFIILNQWTY